MCILFESLELLEQGIKVLLGIVTPQPCDSDKQEKGGQRWSAHRKEKSPSLWFEVEIRFHAETELVSVDDVRAVAVLKGNKEPRC